MIYALKEQFNFFWLARAERERRMLLICALVITLALVYAIFLAPALSGLKQLQTSIPVLNQQLAEMAELSKQQSQLAASLSETISPVSKEQLEQSLTRRGIKPQTIGVNDDIVRVQIPAAGYANLMEWLVEVQKASRLTVEEAKLVSLLESGQVSATLTLRQQRSSQ
ncbi:type II secretion system protein M [Undibacterium sp. CY18W]|uniref:Type II secretion system protein M n=1 Tax=Undibacterium hunanense TaxID=2762292 RepID=A0ABR6ZNC8_9BURK|nr:type II secretion system protein GspM [Undibacterium hunanense]MBC3917401.1 type II secretion system protein M [Undibacterium hunanense]